MQFAWRLQRLPKILQKNKYRQDLMRIAVLEK